MYSGVEQEVEKRVWKCERNEERRDQRLKCKSIHDMRLPRNLLSCHLENSSLVRASVTLTNARDRLQVNENDSEQNIRCRVS